MTVIRRDPSAEAPAAKSSDATPRAEADLSSRYKAIGISALRAHAPRPVTTKSKAPIKTGDDEPPGTD